MFSGFSTFSSEKVEIIYWKAKQSLPTYPNQHILIDGITKNI